MMKSRLLTIAITLLFVTNSNAHLISNDFFKRSVLTGDWYGNREQMENRGIFFQAGYVADLFSNTYGGLQKKSGYLDNVDLSVNINLEKMFAWHGANIWLYGLGNNGINPSNYIGDAQVYSNIAAPSTWKLYEAWIQQNIAGNKFSILAGLYDLNSEFDAMETAGMFINSSFGIGPDFSQTGKNGPSIFPTTSVGVRLMYRPGGNFYVQTVTLDGVPGDPDNPYGTHICFRKQDGLLTVIEAGHVTETDNDAAGPYRKFAVGFWNYSGKFESLQKTDMFGNPLMRKGNRGAYILGEQTIYRRIKKSEKNIALFGRYGIANGDINQFNYYIGCGVVFSGFVWTRPDDRFGLAMARVHNSGHFKQYMAANGAKLKDTETAIELSYQAQLIPWLALQPDIQYIINPGTEATLSNAVVFGIRLEWIL